MDQGPAHCDEPFAASAVKQPRKNGFSFRSERRRTITPASKEQENQSRSQDRALSVKSEMLRPLRTKAK
jgi:hypothetical protein